MAADADVDVDVMVQVMKAWEDQFAVVGFNDVDVDQGELEGNLVEIKFTDLEIVQLETN